MQLLGNSAAEPLRVEQLPLPVKDTESQNGEEKKAKEAFGFTFVSEAGQAVAN